MYPKDYDASRSFANDEDLRIVKIKQLAQELRVTRRTIHRRIKSGKLPEPLRSAGGYTEGWFQTDLNNWKSKQAK
jgi:predicted DNA-binding transcriptional regulator AlpA